MGVQYAGGTIVDYTYATGTTNTAYDMEYAIITQLPLAGWTLTAVPSSAVLTFTGQPSAGQTVTLDSGGNQRVYTFRSGSVPSAYDVLIGATLADSITNLRAAINLLAGAGTLYGTGTLINPTMTVSAYDATTVTTSYKTGGSDGNAAPVATNVTGASWSASTLSGGYNLLKSAITSQGTQAWFVVYTSAGTFYNPGATITMKLAPRDGGTHLGGVGPPVPSTSTSFRIVANRYQFFHFQVGSRGTTGAGQWTLCSALFLPSFMAPQNITAATNATPIVCTLNAHGYSNGDTVKILGGLGNTAINGTWVITYIDDNSFSLDTSVGNGTYTANSAYVANTTQGDRLVEASMLQYVVVSNAGSHFGTATTIANGSAQITNDYDYSASASNVANHALLYGTTGFAGNDIPWFNGDYLMSEPLVGWGYSTGVNSQVIGQLWDAVIVRRSIPLDTTCTFDSHTWLVAGTGTGYSLLVAIA